jgi:NADPH2:quinone reductase
MAATATDRSDAAMSGVVVTAHGGVDVLEVQDLPRPEPAAGQLLVEVAASGINFIDVYRRQGVYAGTPPFRLGTECAGTVVEVGPGVAEFAVGDVVATVDGIGTHATHALVPAERAVAVPAEVDAATAAAVMLQGITAHYLVNATYPLRPGEVALVHAAAGGVGQLLVQLAAAKGARVIATVGSAAKVDIARAAGAGTVIRYDQTDDLARALREVAPGGVDVAYDGVGRATFDASLASLRPRGTLALFGAASGPVPPFDVQRLNSGGSLFLTRPSVGHYIADRPELLLRAGAVLGAVADGSLRVAVGGRYPLAEVRAAYQALESRATTGKLLLIP